MRNMKRWFGALVLGGAALSACTEGDGPEEAAGGKGAEDPVGPGGFGGDQGPGGAASASGGNGPQGGGSEGGSPSAGGSTDCPVTREPNAACGCPCCWVSDCLNDEPCCSAFCDLGNDGAGCCGM
jgi:hypothetical protein